jgi:HAD superfamily hydrolase (TIGR01509 family)
MNKRKFLMLYVFDCDGVLIDSEIIASTVDSELLAEVGYEISPEQVTYRFAGLTSQSIGEIVAAEIGRSLPADFFDRTREEIDRRLARQLTAVPGVHEMLDQLNGYPRCVCSNSSMERLKISLDRTRLWDRFAPHIFSASEVGNLQPKPAPNVYRYAMAQFSVDPRDTVVIEDSAFGVTAAKAAGARVIGFTGGAHTWPSHADVLTEAGAETVINRLADLPATAEALLAWEGLAD